MPDSSLFEPLRNLHQMSQLIEEVTGETGDRVAQRIRFEEAHPGQTVADDFALTGAPRYMWTPQLEAFYGKTSAFLYELVVWNRNAIKSRLRRRVARHLARQQKPLDLISIGDGLGFDCLHLARKGHRVTYFELPGLSEQFARALFRESAASVAVLTDPAAIPPAAFDAMTCFDVLEHVPDPTVLVRSFAAALRPGGLLYVSAPFFMILPWYPTHLRANRKYSGRLTLFQQAGLVLVDGGPSWSPLVFQKPGEGTTSASVVGIVLVRLAMPFHLAGRWFAWPFALFHLFRRAANRPYPQR